MILQKNLGLQREEPLKALRPPGGLHGADLTMAQLVECVPNFSEGRNKEVDNADNFFSSVLSGIIFKMKNCKEKPFLI